MAILLLDVYDDPATRFVGDIDILLPRDLLEAGANRLVERGYRRLPDHAAHAHDPVKLAHPMQPGMIELHQAPVSLAIETIVPARDMLARAVPIEWLPGARVPCPDDLVTHNVAHAMLHHLYFRLAELPLRDAYDLVCVGERFTDSIDWFDVTGRLATGPWGADVFAFYTGAAASIFPEARLPPRRFSPRAAKVLRRWRGRRGRPPRRSEWARARLLEAAEDHCWRLRHVPREWSRLAIRLLAMHRYPSYVRRLICVARSHPQPPSPGRRRTAATWTEAS
jgi:hypothetical protein